MVVRPVTPKLIGPSPTPAPDLAREERNREKAVDLFAGKMLNLEEKFSDDPNADENPQARVLRQFRDREKDDGAAELEQAVGEHVREWMAAFPAEVADRLVLVSVDCRVEECQILLAELSIEMDLDGSALGWKVLQGLVSDDWWRQRFDSDHPEWALTRDPTTTSLGNSLLTIYATRHPASP
ncbi:MAG: hypothetical protein ABIR62_13210 [Dokdonella sp.]|uniref:hypothetical protein n=1 Tax=Dokdonella sp. TaxID=2291710 RepID=UPI0032669965